MQGERMRTVQLERRLRPTRLGFLCDPSDLHQALRSIRVSTTLWGGRFNSLIPLFRRQIEKGGPVTVTDPDTTRYFMTTAEAVSLVIQAGAQGQGGELYILDMGLPMKIADLARKR